MTKEISTALKGCRHGLSLTKSPSTRIENVISCIKHRKSRLPLPPPIPARPPPPASKLTSSTSVLPDNPP